MLERRYPQELSRPEVQLNFAFQNNVNDSTDRGTSGASALEIIVVKGARFFVQHFDGSDRPSIDIDWAAEDRTRGKTCPLIYAFKKTRVHTRIGHNQVLTILDDPPGDPLTAGQS